MSWFRQCCALIRKNRIVKRRLWCSTLAEILLPVAVMLIMVGLRSAVKKTNNPIDLHVRPASDYLTPAQIDQAIANGVPLFKNQTLEDDFGVPFDADTLEDLIWQGAVHHNHGVQYGAATIQFVGDQAPTSVVSQITQAFRARFPLLANCTQQRFGSDEDLTGYCKSKDYATSSANPPIFFAISFQSMGEAGPGPNAVVSYSYTLRGNVTFSDDSSSAIDTSQATVNNLQVEYDSDSFQLAYLRGQLFFQHFVEDWILQREMPVGTEFKRSTYYQPSPTPPYVDDPFADVIATFLGFYYTLIFMWPVTRLVKGIVEEKQLKIKEGMRMMGLPDSALFCSWFTTYLVMFLLTALGITIVTAGSVYERSNKFFIFVFFFTFSMSVFAFCWLVSVFFSRSSVATTCAALGFLVLFFPYFAVQGPTSSTQSKGLACLSAQICFGLGAVVLQKLESRSTGINAATVKVDVDGWSYNRTVGMFILDFFLYMVLAWYFERVVPSEWGTSQRWYFCVRPSFWCPKRVQVPQAKKATTKAGDSSVNGKAQSLLHATDMHNSSDDGGVMRDEPLGHDFASPSAAALAGSANGFIEPVSDSLKDDLGVSIRGLRKTFASDSGAPEQVAVSGMNLDLYSGQILALLGHNGAGKTTTINMLCGMLAPTSGDALVYGSSIKESMGAVRKILGVCPQHNILFNLLTVQEHLELYAAIKGVDPKDSQRQIQEMIAQVGLQEKVHDKSAALSGGMQRKLSVGIALLGDSKIVFLDEPTSGMDPYSRRATWDLLKKKKEGRVIILTTHFMDEADQLGDRIAIMAKGEIKCCGSSLFLKSKYGVGYTLTLTKGPGFNQPAVEKLITDSIPDVSPLSNIAAEISFRLPFQSSAHFADVFDQFDNDQARLGIAGYGISVTTLEEVFLRVGHEEDARPEAVLQQKRALLEKQRRLSIESEKPEEDATPLDLADTPLQAALVVDGNDAFAATAGGSSTGAGAAPTIVQSSVRRSATSAGGGYGALGDDDDPSSSGLPKKAGGKEPLLLRSSSHSEHSSRFSGLTLPANDVSTFGRHFRALFIKRFLNAKRDRKVWTWTLVYPFLILLIGCGLVILENPTDSPRLLVSPGSLDMQTGNFVPATQNPLGPRIFDTVPGVVSNYSYGGTVFTALPASIPQVPANLTLFNQYLLDQIYPSYAEAYSVYTGLQSDVTVTGGSGAAPRVVDNFVVYFNTSCQWAAALGLNMYNSMLLHGLRSASAPPVSISMTLYPLPETLNLQTLTNSMVALIIGVAFAFMPANFISFAVKEEQDKVKHQQLISGVSAASYWAANFAWDFCNYMVMGLLCLLIFRIWSIDTLIGENTGGVLLAIVLYGLAMCPFNYLASFAFENHTSAQNTMLLFYIFCSALLLIATVVLTAIESTRNFAFNIKFVCRLIPSYAFGECIVNILTRGSSTVFGAPQPIFTMQVAGYPMIFLAWEIFAYSGMVLLWEKVRATPSLAARVFGNPEVHARNAIDEDADVTNERSRLQVAASGSGGHGSHGAHPDCIQVLGLRKVYKGRLGGGNKIAVQDLWMGIPQGQCFGFLGINGAGKTTTLKMLTGDIIPGSGTATLNGLDILKQQNDVRRLLGYCPQFDALIDTLTAREHLVLFARIKGVPEDIIDDYAEHLIMRLGLQEGIADKPTKGYSGGNKRKLCVGIALIGNPPIVFLDEPSTGMDPGSRRFMWDLIASTMKHRSVILTTHSMEECEALCHRIGIMVGGRLRCLGSTTHLKNVYGDGYQLDVNVAAGEVQDAFRAELLSLWPKLKVLEQHGDSLKFRLPREGEGGRRTTIGAVFRWVESVKARYGIKDYAASEATLEQIFISFAKLQEEETGKVAGLD